LDLLISTGERSGDELSAAIVSHIQSEKQYNLDISAIAGPGTFISGVRSLFDFTEFATLGLDLKGIQLWKVVLDRIIPIIKADPPRVFLGITNHLFNYIVASHLPPKTHRIMISPPEIWAWQASRVTRALGAIGALVGGARASSSGWARALYFEGARGEACFDCFDDLLCMTPMNMMAYTRLQEKLRAPTNVQFIGHPLAESNRTGKQQNTAAVVRDRLGVKADCHLLSVFPGSRRGTIKRILPTMLEAITEVISTRKDIQCVVNVADGRFESEIMEQVIKARERISEPMRIVTSGTSAEDMLIASSHALLASGTITLKAACLGVVGTVGYAMRGQCLRDVLITRGKTKRGEDVPFSLPNIILAATGLPLDECPYQEYTLDSFKSGEIAEDISRKLPTSSYVSAAHPTLDSKLVAQIRSQLSHDNGKTALELACKYVNEWL